MYDTVKNVETSESKLKTELDLKMSNTNDEEIDWQVKKIWEREYPPLPLNSYRFFHDL